MHPAMPSLRKALVGWEKVDSMLALPYVHFLEPMHVSFTEVVPVGAQLAHHLIAITITNNWVQEV